AAGASGTAILPPARRGQFPPARDADQRRPPPGPVAQIPRRRRRRAAAMKAARDMTAHRILTIAHGHPDFSKAGGELAAYNLHRAYSAARGVEATWFLARAERGRGPSGRIVHRRENEFLWEQGMRSFHEMKALNQFELHGYFTELIQTLKPTVVHVH